MPTLANLRQRFRQFYPEATDEFIDVCINHSLEHGGTLIPGLYATQNLTLTANQSEYALPAGFRYLILARYVKDASTTLPMYATTPEDMSRRNPGWLESQAGIPTHYMFVGDKLRLYPTPDTSTSGGYPVVKLHHVAAMSLLSSPNDEAPAIYAVTQWILAPALEYYASARAKQDLQIRAAEAQIAQSRLIEYAHSRGLDLRPRIRARLNYRPYV